jgi:hypothetical protein
VQSRKLDGPGRALHSAYSFAPDVSTSLLPQGTDREERVSSQSLVGVGLIPSLPPVIRDSLYGGLTDSPSLTKSDALLWLDWEREEAIVNAVVSPSPMGQFLAPRRCVANKNNRSRYN